MSTSLIDVVRRDLLSAIASPILKQAIRIFDVDCRKDGSLLLNSLRAFLGEEVRLCNRCEKLSNNVAGPFYKVGSFLFKADKAFMRKQFLHEGSGEAWLKGFGLMMQGIRKYGVKVPFTPAGPFHVVWNFTYLCNLRCKHCYEDAGARRPELSTDEALKALDILSNVASIGLPSLSLSGGEPLMRKDFFDVAAYAKKKIPYVSLATNGTLVTKDNAKMLKDVGVDYVQVSLDGATAGTHEGFRRVVGCFKRALEGVQNCVEEGIDTCIATVIQKENLSELEGLLRLADELGARFIHFNYIPVGRARAFVELDLTPKERLHVLETIGRRVVDLYIKAKEEELRFSKSNVKVDRFFSTCPQYASVIKRLSQEVGERFIITAHYAAKRGIENIAEFLSGCGAGRLYLALEPNGNIKPCVFFPTDEKTILGNILKDDFEYVWDHNELLWMLRSREGLEVYNVNGRLVGCGVCPDKYICGGCRARAYSYFNGKVNAPDVGCIRNELLWDVVVRKLRALAY